MGGLRRSGCIELAPLRIRTGVGLLETSCAPGSEALSDRLEGELRGLRRLRVGRRLARCGRCRAAFASLAQVVQTLRALRDTKPTGDGSAIEHMLARIREGSARDGDA